MSKLLIALMLLGMQQQEPPPEPDASTPACNNYHNNAHKCECGKAMRCEGKSDDSPVDEGEGKANVKWCKNYCRKDHCKCVSPCET